MTHKGTELFLILLATLPGAALALSTDRDQPVHIEADRGELDDVKGVTIYEGRVVVTQGSIKITGDRVVLHYDDQRDISRAEAVGKPATYQQLSDGESEPLKARALRMDYQVKDGVIDLYDDASVVQTGNSLFGSRITYDTVNERVKASRSGSGEDRVRVILTPKAKDGGKDGGKNGKKDGAPEPGKGQPASAEPHKGALR